MLKKMAASSKAAAVAAIASYLQLLDSESEEDEELLQLGCVLAEAELKQLRKGKLEKVGNYVESVVHRYRANDFQENFRLSRETFEVLLGKLAPLMLSENPGRIILPLDKRVLCGLYIFANQGSFRLAGNLFNVSKSTAWDILNDFSNALLKLNTNEKIISWPSLEEANKTVHFFNKKYGFPGVIGSIDGKHMSIKAPEVESKSYFNRNKFYSLVLQGVCNHKLLFLDCYVGEVGSVHDATVYRRSDVYPRVIRNIGFPEDSHLLGDAAYPISNNLLTPYRDYGNIRDIEKYFNMKLSKCRSSIERAFGLLVGRFRRLKHLDMSRQDLMVQQIMAACVLHNICILYADDTNVQIEELSGIEQQELNPELDNETAKKLGQNKRIQIANAIFAHRRQNID